MSYEPKPGSLAQRAIAYLGTRPPGTELMSSTLAEALGAEGNAVMACLSSAVDHGAVFRRKRLPGVRAPVWWSLTDHAKESNTPQEGVNRDASTGQSHGAEGSASPTGRGNNVAPARGTTPVFKHTPEPGSQHVLKAEAARPDATDSDAPDHASPGGGPTGPRQPAAAGPAGDRAPVRVAQWSDGAVEIRRGGELLLALDAVDGGVLEAYFAR